MTRKERYLQQIKELENKRGRLLRSGKYLEAQNLHDQIADIREKVKEAEKYELKPIAEIMTEEERIESGIIPLIIECHLIADMLTEQSMTILEILKRYGIAGVTITDEIEEITKRCERFASFLTTVSPKLTDLIVRNETLNASLHKKYMTYIERRLNTQMKKEKKA